MNFVFFSTFLSFLSMPMLLSAYLFNSGSLGIEIGYRQDDMNWSFSRPDLALPNSIDEKLKDIHIVQIVVQGMYVEDMLPYFRTHNTYGFSWSNSGSILLGQDVQSSDKSLTALFEERTNYQASGHLWASKTALGYALRFGPITMAPIFGFSYESENLERSDPINMSQTIGNITTSLQASKTLKFDLYLPLIGIDLIFQLGPASRYQLHTGYEYLLGFYAFHSSISSDASVVQSGPSRTTVRNTKTDIHVSRFAYANAFHLGMLFGILPELTLMCNFEYVARKAKAGNSTQTTQGSQTLITNSIPTVTVIDESATYPFGGLFWQSFAGYVDISWTF